MRLNHWQHVPSLRRSRKTKTGALTRISRRHPPLATLECLRQWQYPFLSLPLFLVTGRCPRFPSSLTMPLPYGRASSSSSTSPRMMLLEMMTSSQCSADWWNASRIPPLTKRISLLLWGSLLLSSAINTLPCRASNSCRVGSSTACYISSLTRNGVVSLFAPRSSFACLLQCSVSGSSSRVVLQHVHCAED